MYPTYYLSCATLNGSLALVVEALSGSGEPDQRAEQLVGRTRLALATNCFALQTRRP